MNLKSYPYFEIFVVINTPLAIIVQNIFRNTIEGYLDTITSLIFYLIYRGSNTSTRVLLNLSNKLGKREKARLAEHFIFFATSLIYSEEKV